MGSLVYVEILDNLRYRKVLNRAFPWIRHVGIKHFFMTPFIAAAKDDRSGIVHFSLLECALVNEFHAWSF